MVLFVVSVVLVLCVSAFCSLSEAALYSVRMPYARSLSESGSVAGRVLEGFKRNMERPITAILIVNTVANTAGASIAGAQARLLFGESALFVFSLVFTLAVLFVAEIVPKVAGVTFNQAVSRWVSLPWSLMIRLLLPLVWASEKLARVVHSGKETPLAPEEEVHQVAALSAEEGSIMALEAELVRNVLRLDEVRARDIMTPRTVVFGLPADVTVGEAGDSAQSLPHTRIPIYRDDRDDWVGFVFRSDILACAARDEFETPLDTLCRPLAFVPDSLQGHRLLAEFLRRRQHILAVIDEYGGTQGVVTLEDVMEALIGSEIVDETDLVANLQTEARRQGALRLEREAEPDETTQRAGD
ncbi:MAG: hemolysin family protein [Acidobacteriota bacterium]